jgi:hypothetical protein
MSDWYYGLEKFGVKFSKIRIVKHMEIKMTMQAGKWDK